MNTIRSVWIGWGSLIVAGGGAYFFAKRSINSDRAERAMAAHKQRALNQQMEQNEMMSSSASNPSPSTTPASVPAPAAPTALAPKSSSTQTRSKPAPAVSARGSSGGGTSPSQEASEDPAPTRHAPETGRQRVVEKSKYEASDPFRSKKGDRFS